MIISKTTFLSFLECHKNVWLRIHRPDEISKLELSDFELHLIEQGNEVEAEARKLFPEAIQVITTGDDAIKETLRLMQAKTMTIIQATFLVDGFIAKNDMLRYDATNDKWDLYEVKGVNSVKENSEESRDHINDLAFQFSVLKRAGVTIGHCFIIHLNKEYVRFGEIDLKALFPIDDVTDKIEARLPEIENKMKVAQEYLASEKEPMEGCECIYKARKKHCTSFQLSNPQVPKYSVHDLSRVSKKKLDLFIERGIFDIKDIPDDFELTDNQKNQVHSHQQQKPMIDVEKIKKELDALTFPLYFFDYEAFGPAIPAFNGYGPYKHIPFQFSLHILKNPETELEHVEFLQDNFSDPSEKVVELLKQYVSPRGTVIAWYKHFEKMINKEIGTRLPEHAAFFEEFNNRIYDLMDIFRDQHYVHPGFKGRSSIKKVLPTLAAELRYDTLGIQEGGQAADAWWKMVSSDTSPKEKEQIARDLKVYCGLDTYAMYTIWHHLQKIIKNGTPLAKSLFAPIQSPLA
jgi:Domain of unknown function(DUF2779)